MEELATILQNKADAVTVNTLLPVILSNGVYEWLARQGTLIEKIIIIESATISVNIGTTNGGSDIIEGLPVENGFEVISPDLYFKTDTTLFFTGITSSTVIKIFRR